MRVYLNEEKTDFLDIICLYAKICNKGQSEREKGFGLDILHLTSNGMPYYYYTSKESSFKYGATENYLKKMCDRLLDSNREHVTLTEFRRARNGSVYLMPIQLKNTFSTKGRESRRYLLVNYRGQVLLTDVSRLNKVTKHYKTNRDRNEQGLQWANYVNILKTGGAFNMSYS